MNSDSQLAQLFKACDKRGKGYIVEEELTELCSGLGITAEDSNIIFTDLDQDRDGKICFEDFANGFKEFFNPDAEVQNKRRFSIKSSEPDELPEGELEEAEVKRRESVYQAWNNFTSNLPEVSKLALRKESGTQIQDLLQDLELTCAPPEVASKVSNVLSTLLKEIEHMHVHQTSLEHMYKKERESHQSALKSLENELEDQVAKVEKKARQQARQESEEEKRVLQDQMEEEMAKLNAHLMIFQKVDSWLKKDGNGEEETRKKLDEAYHANRSLHMNLTETATNLGLMRSDMAQLRLQYEEKCRELHSEREQVLEYIHQYDHMKRQLELLHQANKRLQDTNDSMRGAMEYEWRRSPVGSRCSSTRSSQHKAKERRRSQSRSRSPNPPILPAAENDGNIKYGIRRLMDDLDSGLSTLPDTAEEGCTTQDELLRYETDGPMSLEEELLDMESSSVVPSSEQNKRLDEGQNGFEDVSLVTVSASEESPPAKPLRVSQLIGDIEIGGKSPPPLPSYFHKASPYEVMGPPERTYKVVFAGDAAVGKSTFIVRLCKGTFVNNIASTLGVDYKVKTLNVDEKNIAIQLWDTAGQERFRSITRTYFRRADGVLLLYDVTSERSFINVRQWIQSIDEACETRVPLVLCGNKADLRASAAAEGRLTISTADGERLAKDCGANFAETSCKNGTGVLDALVQLSRMMVTTEDVEIQTSALKVTESDQKRFCCGRRI